MSTTLKFKRYTTLQTATVTGADGELTADMSKRTMVLHNGILAGGYPLATEALLNSTYYTQVATNSQISTALSYYDTTIVSEGKISTAISDLVNSAPSTLNTLKELSDALGADANYATTISTALGLKAPLESPSLTGTPVAPTALKAIDTTQIATTAFVHSVTADYAPLESPSLTGIPIAPTALNTVNTTQIATTEYVKNCLADYAVIDSATLTGIPAAPTALKTVDTTQIATTAYVKANLLDYGTVESPTFTGTPAAPTAVAATDTTQIATTAFSQAAIQAAIQVALPAGCITMWSGASTAIPTGWWLCDGTNLTPDLRNKFVIGAGDLYAVAASAGNVSVTLTNTELPAHTHTGTTDADGIHDHFVANTDSVNPLTTGPLSNTSYIGKIGAMSSTSSNYILGGSNTVPTQGLTSPSSSHTHSFTSDSTGSGSAFSILPPYYALCFIMKYYV